MNKTPIRVLLADDDEDDRMIFKDALEESKMTIQITMVTDGIELMEYLHRDDIELPSIVFLDLNMPRKGGIECLQEIRGDKKLKDLTISIYSTSASEADIEDTFIKGANIYIIKPNEYPQLVKILQEVITINLQYHNSNLNRENFVLKI